MASTRPQAWLNGQWIDASDLHIEVHDAGFVLGATVTEQLRTFGGKLFRADEHFDRLLRSLQLVGLDPGLSRSEWLELAQSLVARNHALMDPQDDLGLCIFVTPGSYGGLSDGENAGETVAMHTFRLAFQLWASKYKHGQPLAISQVRQISTQSVPAALKCRSRMHYYLADRDAARRFPGARALLLDEHGHVSETATANVLAYHADRGLIAPPQDATLPGISLAYVRQLAGKLKIPFAEQPLLPADLRHADEVLLTSTPWCLQSVTQLDGQPIGDGKPGPIFRKLLKRWSQETGVNIAEQAQRFVHRDDVDSE